MRLTHHPDPYLCLSPKLPPDSITTIAQVSQHLLLKLAVGSPFQKELDGSAGHPRLGLNHIAAILAEKQTNKN